VAVLNQRYGCTGTETRPIDDDAIDALLHRPWPGNVRELFNVLERAFIASSGSIIRRTDLGMVASRSILATSNAEAAAGATCAQSERALIEHTLHRTGGNKARAARQLGISRKKL
jgi:DNA-binding NtrC family response regulator